MVFLTTQNDEEDTTGEGVTEGDGKTDVVTNTNNVNIVS